MITKNSLPATARHITIKPEWQKIIFNKPAALAYVPKDESMGQLILQVDGYELPGVLDGTPEEGMDTFIPQLFHLFSENMLEIIAKEIATDFDVVPLGNLRAYVRGNEKMYPGLRDNNSWIDYINAESLLRIADKL